MLQAKDVFLRASTCSDKSAVCSRAPWWGAVSAVFLVLEVGGFLSPFQGGGAPAQKDLNNRPLLRPKPLNRLL